MPDDNRPQTPAHDASGTSPATSLPAAVPIDLEALVKNALELESEKVDDTSAVPLGAPWAAGRVGPDRESSPISFDVAKTFAVTARPYDATPVATPAGAKGGVWMHEGFGASDSVKHAGPHAESGRYVRYERQANCPIAICPGFAFTSTGRIVTASMSFGWSALLLLDADGKPPQANDASRNRRIPSRKLREGGAKDQDDPEVHLKLMARKIDRNFLTTSGGAYFVLDRSDAGDVLYLPTAREGIWRLPIDDTGFGKKTTLSPNLRDGDDRLVGVMPARSASSGKPMVWFVSSFGEIGAFVGGERLDTFSMRGEENVARESCGNDPNFAERGESVLNSVAMVDDRLIAASNFALYVFEIHDEKKVALVARSAYARISDTIVPGSLEFKRDPNNPCPGGESDEVARKRGQADFGTGTTPTVVGKDLIAICDGAKEMGLLVYKLEGNELVLKSREQPFAGAGVQACDNSVIFAPTPRKGDPKSLGQIIVANTGGYRNPIVRDLNLAGGITSYWVDVDGKLDLAWKMPDFVAWTATPKLALGNGLLYVYTRREVTETDPQWHVIGLRIVPDAELPASGRIAYVMPVAHAAEYVPGSKYIDPAENSWATFSIAPSGMLIGGVTTGYFTLRDVEKKA